MNPKGEKQIVSPPDTVVSFRKKKSAPQAEPVPTPVEMERRLADLKAEIDALGEDTPFLPQAEQDVSPASLRAPRLFMGVDLVAMVWGFLASWGLSNAINAVFYDRPVSDFLSNHRPSELLLIIAGTLLWFEHQGHYRLRQSFWAETRKIFVALAFAMVFDGFFQFLAKVNFSRLWLISGWASAFAGIVLGRGVARILMRRAGLWQIKTVLIGEGSAASSLRQTIEQEESGLGYEFVGQIENFPQAWVVSGRSWRRLCAQQGAAMVMIASQGGARSPSPEILAQLAREDVPFSIAPMMMGLPVDGMTPQTFFSRDLLLLSRTNNLDQPLPRIVKRSMDLIFSLVAFLVLSPVFALIALLVRLDGGPAFFAHTRLGAHGRRFGCLKFRTMRSNGNELLAKHLMENAEARAEWLRDRKLRDDPRVTRLGHFLRRWSLDELPQLLNVIAGQMSLVGPRPIVEEERDRYDSDIAHYDRVRPGVTGLWQISGRNDVSYEERVQMDSWYVRNWSVWTDIVILLKTIPALLRKTGAY